MHDALPALAAAKNISPAEVVGRTESVNGLGHSVCWLVSHRDPSVLDLPVLDRIQTVDAVEGVYDATIEAIWPEISQGVPLDSMAVVGLMSVLNNLPPKDMKRVLKAPRNEKTFKFDDGLYSINPSLYVAGQEEKYRLDEQHALEEAAKHAKEIAECAAEAGLQEQEFYKTRQLMRFWLLNGHERHTQRI